LTNFFFEKSSKQDLERILAELSPSSPPIDPEDGPMEEGERRASTIGPSDSLTSLGTTPRRGLTTSSYRLNTRRTREKVPFFDDKKSDDGKKEAPSTPKERVDSPGDSTGSESSSSDNPTLPPTSPQIVTKGGNVPAITTTNTSNTTTTITLPKGPKKVPQLRTNLTKKPVQVTRRNFLTEEEHSWVFNATLESLHRKITKRKFSKFQVPSPIFYCFFFLVWYSDTNLNLADGSAALLVLVEHDHKRLIIANSGDERAVLARGDVFF
jgi:hypothetical protein